MVEAVREPEVRATRLAAQRLRGEPLGSLPAVVEHLLAVQSQELSPSMWGLARRSSAGTDLHGALALLDEGTVLRTHLLRPTWHSVLPRDLRWLMTLSGPRVLRASSSTHRVYGVTEDQLERSRDTLLTAVSRGPRTRAELAEELALDGFEATGVPLASFIMFAELTLGIVSGPYRGTQRTYVDLDSRVPPGFGPLGESFDREAAVVELVRRFLASRGLASEHDLARWSGLTLTDVRAGLGALEDQVEAFPGAGGLEGLSFWGPAGLEPVREERGPRPRVDLLQPYDEYVSSYPVTRFLSQGPEEGTSTFLSALAVDGLIVGRWRSTTTTRELRVETQWFRSPRKAELEALEAEAAELARFWGRELGGVTELGGTPTGT